MIRSSKGATLEWEGTNLPEAPTAPETMEQAGLSLGFLNDLILRTLYTRGGMVGLDLARFLCLPFKVIEEPLQFLKEEKCLEVTGGDLIGRVSYRFMITDLGRSRAQEAMKLCGYIGPAPVPLEDYVEQSYRQAVTGIHCDPESLRASFSHLVLPEALFNAIGPSIVSGKSSFLYGPPGNGKTSIATAIGDFMTRAGGEIYVPHAFLSENSVITVFDKAVHQASDDDGRDRFEDNEATIRRLLNAGAVDARWVRIRRPVIITGGELNLAMLDLRFNQESNFYQAPLHIKANGGVFLIDDFGRQLVSPKELLNRWILPLESRHDYLTTADGKKFEVPFEELIIFSTNLDPRDLVDEAFLRRIRHKVEIRAPEREVYERIFTMNARRLGMNQCAEAIDYLYDRYYLQNRSPRCSDCRDLLEIVQAICRYRKQPVQLTKDLIAEAAETFISEF
jgi:predicted ATPase with chaperone activity